jgi:diaminobutyrate-2-oxoglutarate transaminase
MSALDQHRIDPPGPGMDAFEELESRVRSYCRRWPVTFDGASGSWIYDESGRSYLDFFSGAGSLNYGHNDPVQKQALIDYIASDRIVQSLDMFTTAKRDFLVTLDELVLRPRGLSYRMQFAGPGGANSVEAALKLARKVTGRTTVVCFDGGFHGVTLGALSMTANPFYRTAAGVPLDHAVRLPFSTTHPDGSADLSVFDRLLGGNGNGQPPAGVIVEAVQGEGGVRVASPQWLAALAERCSSHDIPLILDEVQMGCGRTGPFFAFEESGIRPDIVCLAKSISGYGLPLSLTLIREDLDVWEPGEHNGTFRGVSAALVTGAAALRGYWADDSFERRTLALGDRMGAVLRAVADSAPAGSIHPRGRGMARGLAFQSGELASRVSAAAFERGVLVETSGPDDEVVKLLPALNIGEEELDHGLALVADAVGALSGTSVPCP